MSLISSSGQATQLIRPRTNSTIVVSCIRLGALATYATSTNPLYDNLMAGVYSVLELNIGLMCVYMPALRRFLAQLTPRCFATTRDDW